MKRLLEFASDTHCPTLFAMVPPLGDGVEALVAAFASLLFLVSLRFG